MCNVVSLIPIDLAHDRKGGMDPAVSVHHTVGNLLDDAVDGIANVLGRRHQQRTYHQYDKGGLQMKLSYCTLYKMAVELTL